MLGTYIIIYAVAWAFLCAIVASSRERGALAWLLAGGLFGLFAFLALIASGRPSESTAGKKACPTCAEMIGVGAIQCPHCQHRFAEQTINLPKGWPHWPGVGRSARAYCHYCDNLRTFDEGGTCKTCGRQDPLIRYFWGYRTERPTEGEIAALRAT